MDRNSGRLRRAGRRTRPGASTLAAGLAGNRAGSVSIAAAAGFALLAAIAALAIDLASLYVERRDLQGVSDVAAMAGVADLANAERVVAEVLDANGVAAEARVVRGRYVADANVPHDARFTPGERPFNALRVEVSRPGRVFFARVFDVQGPRIGVSALAATAELASFQVGSRLLALRGGVANALLGGLLGTNVSLSAMDYRGLADVDLDIVDLLQAVNAQADLRLGTYDEVAAAEVSLADFLAAAASVAGNSGAPAAGVALQRLSRSAARGLEVPLSALFDAGPYGGLALGDRAPGLDIRASAMQLVSIAGILANGARQISVDLGAEVPGLLSLDLDLAVGEPMQGSPFIRVGAPASTVSTAQTRLRLVAEVGGRGLLGGIAVRFPLALDLAYARAGLAEIRCRAGRASRVSLEVRPGVAEAWIGEVAHGRMDDFSRPLQVTAARIVRAPLINASARAHVRLGSAQAETVHFSRRQIERRTVQRVASSGLVGGLAGSLLEDIDLEVRVLMLGLSIRPVSRLIGTILSEVAAPVDAVLETLLLTLGVSLGEADVSVQDVRCDGGTLAG